jgi:hypothetical protein
MISTFKIKTTKGVHVQPYYEILLKKGKFINELYEIFIGFIMRLILALFSFETKL